MITIDVEDTGLIDAEPAAVRAALMDEIAGRTHWWAPYLRCKQRGSIPVDQVGGIFDGVIHSGGFARFTARVIELSEHHVRLEYTGGDFRGEGTWTLEPEGSKTRVCFHWHVIPAGWLGLMLRFGPGKAGNAGIGDSYHAVMRKAFEGLNRRFQAVPPPRAS